MNFKNSLEGKDLEIAEDVDAPIEEMNRRSLEAVGFSEEGIQKIMALNMDEPWRNLLVVNGIGPKIAKKLYEDHDISTVSHLRDAISSSHPIEIPNMNHIRRSINWVDEPRIPLQEAHKIVDQVEHNMGDLLERFRAVGSYRRRRDTVGDIDALAIPLAPTSEVQNAFKDMCDYVIRCGERKMTGRFMGAQVDIQLVTYQEWPFALQYFTGPMDHNIKLRRAAKVDGLKLNEYGLFDRVTEERLDIKSEVQLYERLLGEYISPTERE